MADFIKDCIHELKDLDIKNIDRAYIKELEIKIKADFTTVKRGEKPITELRDMIAAEKMYVRGFLYRMDTAIREDVKEWNKIQEWPTYEHIPEKDIVEQSIVFGTIRHLHFEKTGIETKGLNITLEEAQKTHALAFYVPFFMEYLEFLKRTNNDIINVINDPEYWKAREENIGNAAYRELPDAPDVKSYPKTNNSEDHYLMQRLKRDSPITYNAMHKALENGLVTFESEKKFNFHCNKGCVGLFFKEGGFTEYKVINGCILINEKTPARTTLENGAKNTPPKSWEEIKEKYFGTPAE